MPASALQAARRERGWTQSQVLARLRRASTDPLPAESSLARMLSRWENGAEVSDYYQRLFCRVFEAPPEALGFAAEPSPELAVRLPELDERLAIVTVDAGLISILESQTQNFRMLDRRLGAAHLLPQTEAHVQQLENLLQFSLPGSNRSALARALAEAASLTGWQALDVGAVSKAWRYYEIAKSAAREGENPAVLAHVTAEQTYALLDSGRTSDALALVTHAHQQQPQRLPSLLRCWLYAAEGEVRAALGDERGARKVLDEASRRLPADPEDPELPFLMLNPIHLARWRGHCLARLGADEAVEDLSEALAGIEGASLGRAEAGLRIDLALALTAKGDATGAQTHARRAAEIVGRTGSARQRARIARLLAGGQGVGQ
jgi:tetratricopeptide (TPR) repeat protein